MTDKLRSRYKYECAAGHKMYRTVDFGAEPVVTKECGSEQTGMIMSCSQIALLQYPPETGPYLK